MSQYEDAETARQWRLLTGKPGPFGSGAARYAAAMYFFDRGDMTVDMLEIYRCCSKQDQENPLDLARYEGIAIPPSLQTDDPA